MFFNNFLERIYKPYNYIYLISNIFTNIFNIIFNFSDNILKKNQNVIIKKEVESFLEKLYKDWKNNKINNIDFLCDILCLFIKYKNINLNEKDKINNGNNNENNSENNSVNDSGNVINNFTNEDMKYYVLGWYLHQSIKEN